MRSIQVNYLVVHTLLVLVSFSLFFGFVLDVVRPAPADTNTKKYGGLNCLHHITHSNVDNIRGDTAIYMGTITFMLVTLLTVMRLMSHWGQSKMDDNYKVASLFSALTNSENRVVNVILLVVHVMSAVFIWSLHAHTQTTSKHEIANNFLNACTSPDELPKEMSMSSGVILTVAILLEVGLWVWNWSCKSCTHATYSFKETNHGVLADKIVDAGRNFLLLATVITVYMSFIYSLNGDLNCQQNEVRSIFFALFFAVAALCMVTTKPEPGAKRMACITAAFAVIALVSLNFAVLISDPHANACTNTMDANNKRIDNAEHLRTNIILSLIHI